MRQSVPEARRSRSGQVASLTGQSLGGGELAGRHAAELVARGDVELQEDLAQVVLHGTGADEQLSADLGVGETFLGEPSDLRLLRREDAARLFGALSRRLSRGEKLATGTLREALGADLAEHLVGRSELLPSVHSPVLAPQPFAVQEPGAAEVDDATSARQPVDGLPVERLGGSSVAEQRARAGLDAERPIGAARLRAPAQA